MRKNIKYNKNSHDSFVCSYEFSKSNIQIERTIVVIDGHTIVVKNEAHVSGSNTLKTLWNIENLNKLIIANNQIVINTPKGVLYISHDGDKVVNQKKHLSRHYNEECEIEQLRIEKDFVDKGVVYVVISDIEHTPEVIRKYLDISFLKQTFPEELSPL